MKSSLGLAAAIALLAGVSAFADDEAESTPGSALTVRCLLLVRAETAFPPASSQQVLMDHQQRMRTICWDFHALSVRPDRSKAVALLKRCLAEAPFDMARAHELYYERHVKSIEEMCQAFGALVHANE